MATKKAAAAPKAAKKGVDGEVITAYVAIIENDI